MECRTELYLLQKLVVKHDLEKEGKIQNKVIETFCSVHEEKLSGSECVYLFAGVWK